VKRNVFCSICAPALERAGGPGGPRDPPKSALPLELVSTLVCPTDDRWSMAVIRDLETKEKDPGLYSRGRLVGASGATVVRVVNKRVYLRNAGRLEYVEIEPAGPIGAPSPPAVGALASQVRCAGASCVVERPLVEKLLADPAALAGSARLMPAPGGFRLYAIRPGSIFTLLGLKNGDTVKAVNGLELSSPERGLEIYTQLRRASHLTVSIERQGEHQTLDYVIR
jgi:general secretion pathway protein C